MIENFGKLELPEVKKDKDSDPDLTDGTGGVQFHLKNLKAI